MGRIGPAEIIFIVLVVVLLFGVKKLPELGAAVGKAIKEFKKAGKDVDQAIKESTDEEKKS